MARGKALSDDLRNVVLNLARRLDVDAIVDYTGLKKRTIQRIIEDYRKRRLVTRAHLVKSSGGRQRILTTGNMRVIILPSSYTHAFIYVYISESLSVSRRYHTPQPRLVP